MGKMILTEEQIYSMVELIVKKIKPQKVLLFGSYAQGRANSDSDIDLLIVTESKLPRHCRSIEIKKLLKRFQVPKDIIVVTPSEFERYQHLVGTIIRPAVQTGKVLYG